MVAFSRRCEEPDEFFLEDSYELRTGAGFWFWSMLSNLSLDRFDNHSFSPYMVHSIVEIMLIRNYDRNGRGGMFPLRHTSVDQRNVEILFQFNAWRSENFG